MSSSPVPVHGSLKLSLILLLLLSACHAGPDTVSGGRLRFSARFAAQTMRIQAIPEQSAAIAVAIWPAGAAAGSAPEHKLLLTPEKPAHEIGLLAPGGRRVVALAFDARNTLLAGDSASAEVRAGQTAQVSLELESSFAPNSSELESLKTLLQPTQPVPGASPATPAAVNAAGVSASTGTLTDAAGSPGGSQTSTQPASSSQSASQNAPQPSDPSAAPSASSSSQPGAGLLPSIVPSSLPSSLPSAVNGALESALPGAVASLIPEVIPSAIPSVIGSVLPSALPSVLPTIQPTALPSAVVSAVASVVPSVLPTALPSVLPTILPTVQPSTCTLPFPLCRS